jgi:hypothetical protein
MINNSRLNNDLGLLEEIDSFLHQIDNRPYSGYSVYDCFNSPTLKLISKLNIKILNVIITQAFKQIPFNIRAFFGVKKSINPKSLGLILKARLLFSNSESDVKELYKFIIKHRNKDFNNLCWGYNWDYYTLRGGTFPKYFPNAIVTYFIGEAFLDYYLKYPSKELEHNLFSIRKYFLEDINRTTRNNGICFSYSSSDNKEIYNASALISRFLYRLNEMFQIGGSEIIEKSINYLISVQNNDGSWFYGYAPNQKWIDSFHTEYMLEFFNSLSVANIEKYNLKNRIKKANEYYLNTFFLDEVCNYFPDKKYPINIHSIASRIIYLSNINKLDEAEKIIDWTFINLYNSRKQSFYFEKRKYFVNKNIYHRWNQAWMYLALSCYKKMLLN